ncbi:MAG: VacJ family lipoprotein [Desulfovibrionaceae bacterium]|nr:VacJ family lipoprotein [Desulfovibrionaceae bacterium]
MRIQAATAIRRAGLTAALCALVAGCASVAHPDPRDPWEGYNRGMTSFNDTVDGAILKPVALAYRAALPQLVRTGVSNFFSNLGDVWSFVNNVLQAKPEGALSSFWRVAINTTLGLGGVFDPATEMHLQRRREDFGQTLGYWGVPPGPYFVLPILGPSTLRDTVALPADWYGNPVSYVHDVPVRNSLHGTQFVDMRSQLLEVGDLLDAAALDSYTFRRDAYLQKRLNDIYDGNPPQNQERYDLDEGQAPAAAAASSAEPSAAEAGH